MGRMVMIHSHSPHPQSFWWPLWQRMDECEYDLDLNWIQIAAAFLFLSATKMDVWSTANSSTCRPQKHLFMVKYPGLRWVSSPHSAVPPHFLFSLRLTSLSARKLPKTRECLHEKHQTTLTVFPLGLNQLAKLVHLIVQGPHIPHDNRWNSSSTESRLFPP